MELRIVFDHIELYQGMLNVLREYNHFFESDIPEDNTVTEEKRQWRIAQLEKFKGGLAKHVENAYIPKESEFYEQ